MKTKEIVSASMFTAIYYVMTTLIAPLSFGAVQCRLSEVLLLFCINNPSAVIGYTLGCALGNLSSPLGIIDIVFGATASFAGAMFAYKVKKIPVILSVVPAFYGIVIGAELYAVYKAPFVISAITVGLGELIALMIGCLIYKCIGKRIERVL